MRAGFVLVVLALALVLSLPAAGEHTPDHRYYVTGTVTNDLGQPVCGLTVRATDTNTPGVDGTSRTATTDGQGRFLIQLHLHSDEIAGEQSNVGDTLVVAVEGTDVTTTVSAGKNTNNPAGWGQQTVELVVPSSVKEQCLGLEEIALYGGGAAGVLAVAFFGVRFVRSPRRGGRGARRGLMEIPGVGRARARELETYGIRSVEDLAEADPEDLAEETSLTPKQARLLVTRANESLKE
ncbi:MAG: hypothetical protein HY557_07580 [Euryarchaeota archaeon]|nr:hypothetical protein [Euryarchaeota archaeon]